MLKIKVALKNWCSFKNISRMFFCFIGGLLIRIFLKYLELNMGRFESDFLFYMSSFTGISDSSFIRKFLELSHFPNIDWSWLKVYIKSLLSEKIKIIKDLVFLFYSVKYKGKITREGWGDPNVNNNNLNKCDYTKSLYLFMENKGESSVNNKDVATNSNTYKGDKNKPIKLQ